MTTRSTQVTFTNSTDRRLVRQWQRLTHGSWTGRREPAAEIDPGETVDWACGSGGLLARVEGAVRYAVARGDTEVRLRWTNPLIGRCSYEETVGPGWALRREGGTGHRARVRYVLEPAVSRTTAFRPSTHGFGFANSWPRGTTDRTIDLGVARLPIGDAANGLCGGMVYAALDYFRAGTPVPARTSPPPGEGDALFDYLVRRQVDSLDLPKLPARLYALMAPHYPDADGGLGLAESRSAIMVREAWPRIRAGVDAGEPVPICLLRVRDSLRPGDLGRNHQVLVWGYRLDGTGLTLSLYDPNSPGADGCTLRLDVSRTDRAVGVEATPRSLGPVHCFLTTAYREAAPPR